MSVCLTTSPVSNPTDVFPDPLSSGDKTDQPPMVIPPENKTPILTPPGQVTSEFPTLEVALQGLAKTATLVGFDEFTTPSVPPRKFRQRNVTGSLDILKTYNNAVCNQTQPGGGQQSGDFFVFIFVNEVCTGTVNVILDTVGPDGRHYYTIQANWSTASTVIDRPTAVWYARVDSTNFFFGTGTATAIGNFDFAAGTEFVVSIGVSAVFGFGIGAWTYRAGNYEFTDTWALEDTVDDDGNVTLGGTTQRAFYSILSDIPDRNSGVTNRDPAAVYEPESTIVVMTEPVYVQEGPTTATSKQVSGLGCVENLSGFGYGSVGCDGSVFTTLTNEDTEILALARAAEVSVPETEALYEQRGAGEFTFIKRRVRFTFTISGLQIGTQYNIRIPGTLSNEDGSSPVDYPTDAPFTAPDVDYSFQVTVEINTPGKKIVFGNPTLDFA
jgi:hypothetical protein